MDGVIQRHDGSSFGSHLVESVVLGLVSVIADAANDYYRHVLLVAGVEHPLSLHFSYHSFVVNALETLEKFRVSN